MYIYIYFLLLTASYNVYLKSNFQNLFKKTTAFIWTRILFRLVSSRGSVERFWKIKRVFLRWAGLFSQWIPTSTAGIPDVWYSHYNSSSLWALHVRSRGRNECKAVPRGWKRMGKGPSRGTAAQKHLKPDGVWPVPVVVYIWVRMEMASGHHSSLSLCCTVSRLLCWASAQ